LRGVFTCGPFPHLPRPRAALPFAVSNISGGIYIQTDIKLPSEVTRPHPTPPHQFFFFFFPNL
jgi:hypothetical protein